MKETNMADTTFNQVRNLVNQLTLIDQARLLEYLTSRVAGLVKSGQFTDTTTPASKDAWKDFFRIGEEIESSDSLDAATLTSTLISMRR
jgi:hypothetical protein